MVGMRAQERSRQRPAVGNQPVVGIVPPQATGVSCKTVANNAPAVHPFDRRRRHRSDPAGDGTVCRPPGRHADEHHVDPRGGVFLANQGLEGASVDVRRRLAGDAAAVRQRAAAGSDSAAAGSSARPEAATASRRGRASSSTTSTPRCRSTTGRSATWRCATRGTARTFAPPAPAATRSRSKSISTSTSKARSWPG